MACWSCGSRTWRGTDAWPLLRAGSRWTGSTSGAWALAALGVLLCTVPLTGLKAQAAKPPATKADSAKAKAATTKATTKAPAAKAPATKVPAKPTATKVPAKTSPTTKAPAKAATTTTKPASTTAKPAAPTNTKAPTDAKAATDSKVAPTRSTSPATSRAPATAAASSSRPAAGGDPRALVEAYSKVGLYAGGASAGLGFGTGPSAGLVWRLKSANLPFVFRADISGSRFSQQPQLASGAAAGDATLLHVGGAVGFEWVPGANRSLRPYLTASGGFYRFQGSGPAGTNGDIANGVFATTNDVALLAGAGLRLGQRLFLEARLVTVGDFQSIPVVIGVHF